MAQADDERLEELTRDPETGDYMMAQVEDTDHPELYDIEKEAREFNDAIEELDDTWDDAEAQIKWWQTVPVGWPNFVGEWTNTLGEGNDLWTGDGEITVMADG